MHQLSEENRVATYHNIIDYLSNEKELTSIALGGSRSKNFKKKGSDFDIFCLSNNIDFFIFKKDLTQRIQKNIKGILFCSEYGYYKNYGYLISCVSLDFYLFDVFVLPKHRVEEMGIMTTNKIIKDTDKLYTNRAKNASDEEYLAPYIIEERKESIITSFYIILLKLKKYLDLNDYWMALRYLEKAKEKIFIIVRMELEIYPKSILRPEENANDDIQVFSRLSDIYLVDGTIQTLINTMDDLVEFIASFLSDPVFQKVKKYIKDT